MTKFKVEVRFSWMDHRETKRQEDKAYSLLGIFDVHMPLIYREGNKAFVRLREAVDGTSLVQEQKDQQHRIISDWVSSIDFGTQQSDLINQRQEGTGVWFTDSPDFLDWLQSSNQALFCPGIPGAGKTMIAAIAVNHLWKQTKDQDIGLAYIYCSYKTQAEQKAGILVSTILKQLIQERPSIAEPVKMLYEHHRDRRTRPSLEEIQTALRAVISSYSRVYVAIDALDECQDDDGSRSQLLAILRDLQSKANLNLMVTSRFIPEIKQKFSLSPVLEIRASASDVECFVAGQIRLLPGFVQGDVGLQKAVQDQISMAVDGMLVLICLQAVPQTYDKARFLLARLHIESLRNKTTKKKILVALYELPKALDDAYHVAIERIERQPPDYCLLARKALSWITYARRPLTTRELCHALAVEPGESELDLDNIPHVENIVSVCAGLVIVNGESNIIRLVHYTTQEYFERIRERWIPQAQQDIASACLTYLSFDSFKSGSSPDNKQLESRLEKNVLLDYASRNWGQHTRTVQEQLCELASSFLQDSNLVFCAVQTRLMSESKYSDYSQRFPTQATGLQF